MAAAETFDVVILGGGPAGSAAAIALCGHGLRALVLEARDAGHGRNCAGWMSPAAVRVAQELGLSRKAAGAADYSGMTLHSLDFSRRVEVADESLAGWIVDRGPLDESLRKRAASAGAKVLTGVAATDVRVGEAGARVQTSSGRAYEGRILLVADGMTSPGARLANIPPIPQSAAPTACALAVLAGRKSGHGLEVVLGAGRAGQVGVIVRAGEQVRVLLLSRDVSTPVSAQMEALLRAGARAKVLPDAAPQTVAEVRSLGGLALELEGHVGKRSLLIGDAGGFVTAFSHEGIYPAMRSAQIAADVAARALRAALPQDELAGFETAWRAELADYLRMPNTDLGLLIPLIFSNAQMSARVAKAFLLGQGL